MVLTQLDPIAVIYTLSEDDLPRTAKQLLQGPIQVVAFARDGVTKLGEGNVSFIDNQINTTTATIRLKAVFANPNRALWPNEFVKARMVLSTRKNAVVVPAPVVQRGPSGVFAYLVTPQKTVTMRPIEVDLMQGEIAIVSKGLSPGDQVVSDGQNQLKEGSRISVRPPDKASMMATDQEGNLPGSPSEGGSATARPKKAPKAAPGAAP